jgi:hypothetical protein
MTDEASIGQAIEGDSAALQLFVTLLRERMEALPPEIFWRYGVFITLTKRRIKTAYTNAVGDEAFGL